MLTRRDIGLNPGSASVDVWRWMSSHDSSPVTGRRDGDSARDAVHDPQSAAGLAHGLANLPGAGMRQGGLVIPVVVNARRRSIEALCGEPAASDPRIDVTVGVDAGHMVPRVLDNGPGLGGAGDIRNRAEGGTQRMLRFPRGAAEQGRGGPPSMVCR